MLVSIVISTDKGSATIKSSLDSRVELNGELSAREIRFVSELAYRVSQFMEKKDEKVNGDHRS